MGVSYLEQAIVRSGLVPIIAIGFVGAVNSQEFRGRGWRERWRHDHRASDGRPTVIRLHGIDAPEKGQVIGTRAKQFAASLAFGKTVIVSVRGRDRYCRTIGDATLPDGRHLNQELVHAGYAVVSSVLADYRLSTLEAQARSAHRGLWADLGPVPPWEWRRSQQGTRLRGRGR
jgi:endonuclease YncB( thermonuclease family)